MIEIYRYHIAAACPEVARVYDIARSARMVGMVRPLPLPELKAFESARAMARGLGLLPLHPRCIPPALLPKSVGPHLGLVGASLNRFVILESVFSLHDKEGRQEK